MQQSYIPWNGEEVRIQGLFLVNESETVIFFNGCKYKKNQFGYWLGGRKQKGFGTLHRSVWGFFNGEIPKEHIIHHIDGNKSNNEIENLKLMHYKEHNSIHMSTEERKFISRQTIKKAQEAAREWHGTQEGLEWHKKHGKETWNNKPMFKRTCEICQKEYESKWEHSRMCSNACRSEFRRRTGKDDEFRKCEICQEEFKCNKYRSTKTCSKECRTILGHRNRSLRSRS